MVIFVVSSRCFFVFFSADGPGDENHDEAGDGVRLQEGGVDLPILGPNVADHDDDNGDDNEDDNIGAREGEEQEEVSLFFLSSPITFQPPAPPPYEDEYNVEKTGAVFNCCVSAGWPV